MVRKRKEEQRMKTLKGVLIFIFLTGMILGVAGPALLYGAETSGGNPWDSCVNCYCFDKKAHGTKISGTLSIYYAARTGPGGGYDTYLTLRLEDHRQLYVYRGMGDFIVHDVLNDTGYIACDFIGTVIPQIFPANTGWNVKSIDDAWGTYEDEQDLHSRAFVVDITIAVKE
jgi:hypothetical protein